MKKIKLYLAGLIVVLVFTQIAVTSSEVSSFDYMADVNRDGIVDIHDLERLGEAYGSSLALPSETNKTVVAVLSFDKQPPEVENARVAIIDPEVFSPFFGDAVAVQYTNSSGITTFDLGSNRNYTAVAWRGSAYNYANFTTNLLGEASILIMLGEPSLPPTRALPQGWVIVTFLDNETGSVIFEEFMIKAYRLWYSFPEGWLSEAITTLHTYGGVIVLSPELPLNEPYSGYGLRFRRADGLRGSTTYSPDENGCANVVLLC